MKSVLKEASKIFKKLANNSPDQDLKLDLEIHKKLLSLFQVGDYYYYVFNLKLAEFDFVSPEVESVLGYQADSLTLALFLSSIHPEDAPWFLNFENKVHEFFSGLHEEQILKYKVRYDYRVKKSNGEYIRILQQVVTLQYQAGVGLLRTFGIHTDITHLKKEGRPIFSLIGLDGEPSFIDIDVAKVFAPSRSIISEREKQVLHLLVEGNNSKAIADQLFISRETVDKHRKNMLRKTSAATTPELVAMAIKKGWL